MDVHAMSSPCYSGADLCSPFVGRAELAALLLAALPGASISAREARIRLAAERGDLTPVTVPGYGWSRYRRHEVVAWLDKLLEGDLRDRVQHLFVRVYLGELRVVGRDGFEETGWTSPTARWTDRELLEAIADAGCPDSDGCDEYALERDLPSAELMMNRLAIWSWGRLFRHAHAVVGR
jgi:hypothetical protein